jgi:plasmid stabilization system protein ParE
MAYRVELSRRAKGDLQELYERVLADESVAARVWFDGLENAIASLQRFPRRCPIAPESSTFGLSLRHLLYGAKSDVYRIIYDLDENRRIVNVVTVRHGSMDEFVGGK